MKLDQIRNERIKGIIKVMEISKKIHERRLQWYSHVMSRDKNCMCKRAMALEVEGTRGSGRPKRRWMDSVKVDLREKSLVGDQFEDREEWHLQVANTDPI